MTTTAIRAGNFPIYLNTGTTGSPTWTIIQGVKNLSLTTSAKEEDVSEYNDDNDGFEKSIVLGRGKTVTLDGFAKYDADGVKDAGQAALEVLGKAIGAAANAQFKISLPDDGYDLFTATVLGVTPYGGDQAGIADWKAELKLTGEMVYVEPTP